MKIHKRLSEWMGHERLGWAGGSLVLYEPRTLLSATVRVRAGGYFNKTYVKKFICEGSTICDKLI